MMQRIFCICAGRRSDMASKRTAKKNGDGRAVIEPSGPLTAAISKIPALIDLRRATFGDASIEMCAAVARALGMPLRPERDPRFYDLTPERLRGHNAVELAQPPAASLV